MKKIVVIALLLITLSLFANEFKLIEFRKLPADFHAERNSVQDMDREYCTALKIETDVPIELKLKQKVYKKDNAKSNVNYFFVTHKETQITFTAPNFDPLTVNVPDGGLKKGVVFYVNLEVIPDVTITFNISPDPDRIIMNGQIKKKNRFKIAPGEYQLQIEKQGYKSIDEMISIDEQNTYFNYSLTQTDKLERPVLEESTEPIVETPSEPSQFSLERYDIVFEITSCEMYEDQIVMELEVTNNGDDRDVTMLGWGRNRTRIFDDVGNEFFPQKINFANKSNSGDVKIMLVNGVPTKASLIFKDIKKKAVKLTKFDMGIWTQESDSFRMTFRDIQIEKK
jgi:PEGA domain